MAKIEKIIFVDDDAVCTFLNVTLVEELDIAKQVYSFQNASDALTYIRDHYSETSPSPKRRPDLIFLNVRMPGIDGFEFLENLEKLENVGRSTFKIIMLTALAHPSDQQKAALLSDKVIACLPKPLAKETIVELLAAGAFS